ncbi:hypothetical protein GCM10009675_12780 [Prauserella alba]|uniref:Uncharacterized protein n=1 Tax=Prauserella alba TaxID=176898 RepID=A0ABN1V848_9PSEU
MIQQGLQQADAVAEPAEHGALADLGRGGDGVHGQPLDAVLVGEPRGCCEQPGAIPYGIGAQSGFLADRGQREDVSLGHVHRR